VSGKGGTTASWNQEGRKRLQQEGDVLQRAGEPTNRRLARERGEGSRQTKKNEPRKRKKPRRALFISQHAGGMDQVQR